jgi:hypothetical protein
MANRSQAQQEQRRDQIAALDRGRHRSIRDIGLPDVPADWPRREATRLSLRAFCETYLPATFPLAWGPAHLRAIARMESVVLAGGQYSVAMPRGSGKTSLAESACLWATLHGHRRFVVLIGASEPLALRMQESMRQELETNDTLAEDFPEVCKYVRALEGIGQRANGQLADGKRTFIELSGGQIVYPSVSTDHWDTRPVKSCSGAVIMARGLTGAIRGLKFKRPDGESSRPDLVILDDPQTDESARSLSQCNDREAIVKGAVLGLAGPGVQIAAVMPCTVIQEGDLADRFLSRELHPDWQGERSGMLVGEPVRKDLWEEYEKQWNEGHRQEKGMTLATDFYKKNQAEMDAGLSTTWPARHNPSEASAIQHAMNLKIRDEHAFWAEYQNQPKRRDASAPRITIDGVCERINNHTRGTVPNWAHAVTAMIDVQGEALFYVVCAWGDHMKGAVIDYGVFPEQPGPSWTLANLRRTLTAHTKITGLDGRIYQGLTSLCTEIVRPWMKDDGTEMMLDLCLIDANWGDSTDVVYQFCRESRHQGKVMPSHGRGVGASGKPFSEYTKKPGDKVGHYWRVPTMKGKRGAVRHILFDSNYWKTHVSGSLQAPPGERGAVMLYGDKPRHHTMLAEHLTAEYPIRTAGRGREVDEWKALPGRDNHWLDCLVGCAVGASVLGIPTAAGLASGDRVARVRHAPNQRSAEKQAERKQAPRPPRGPRDSWASAGGGENWGAW